MEKVGDLPEAEDLVDRVCGDVPYEFLMNHQAFDLIQSPSHKRMRDFLWSHDEGQRYSRWRNLIHLVNRWHLDLNTFCFRNRSSALEG